MHEPIWYLPVPLLLGVIGLMVAGANATLMLPAEYKHLDMKPAWGLARALPIEMIGVGLVVTLAMLRDKSAEAQPKEAS